MMAVINVRLISPALIGGHNPRRCDHPPQLRPTEIRAMLRFWTRAVAAGAGLDYREEEVKLWGDTDKSSKIRILPVDLSQTHQIQTHPLFPHKPPGNQQAIVEMIDPDSSVISFRFLIHPQTEMNKFFSILWIWLHLGTIGRRSRRGYGSLVWEPGPNDALADFIQHDPEKDWTEENKIQEYLRRGISKVETVWGAPKISGLSRATYRFFQLHTSDQIFVGKILKSPSGVILTRPGVGLNSFQHLIHGVSLAARRLNHTGTQIGANNEEREMGDFRNRLASPMLWRLLPCGTGLVPVMTWSPRYVNHLTPGTRMQTYLNGVLGFSNSLMGNPL